MPSSTHRLSRFRGRLSCRAVLASEIFRVISVAAGHSCLVFVLRVPPVCTLSSPICPVPPRNVKYSSLKLKMRSLPRLWMNEQSSFFGGTNSIVDSLFSIFRFLVILNLMNFNDLARDGVALKICSGLGPESGPLH